MGKEDLTKFKRQIILILIGVMSPFFIANITIIIKDHFKIISIEKCQSEHKKHHTAFETSVVKNIELEPIKTDLSDIKNFLFYNTLPKVADNSKTNNNLTLNN